jgi:hypothetical protein
MIRFIIELVSHPPYPNSDLEGDSKQNAKPVIYSLLYRVPSIDFTTTPHTIYQEIDLSSDLVVSQYWDSTEHRYTASANSFLTDSEYYFFYNHVNW